MMFSEEITIWDWVQLGAMILMTITFIWYLVERVLDDGWPWDRW